MPRSLGYVRIGRAIEHLPARMTQEEAPLSERSWRIALAALCAAITLWPVAWGWNVVHAIGAACFLLLFAWLPGRALVAWTYRPATALERILLAWVAGLALLGIVFVAGAEFGERRALWLLPLAGFVALLVGRGRQAEAERLPLPSRNELAVLALVLLLALVRARPDMPHEWYLGYGSDDEFHAGNAAELRWRWPMGDPRIAGEPLRYHFLSYCVPAGMGALLGLPVRECLLGLTQHHTPLLFAFGIFVLARALGARPWIAAGTALALVLQMDLFEFAQALGGSNWWAASPFYVGIYRSITNSAGLCLLLGLMLVLHGLLARGAAWRGALLLAFVIAVATAITKSSVLPPLLGGFGLALVWKLVRTRAIDARLLGGLTALALGAAPATLWFLADKQGYAYSMFRFVPSHALRTSPFAERVAALVGVGDPVGSTLFFWLLTPVWLVSFFALTTLGVVFWLRAREKGRDPFEVPLFGALLVGLVPSLLLASPGLSQLFFGYVSITAAALLGALGTQRMLAAPGRRARLLSIVAVTGLCVYGAASLAWIFVKPNLPSVESGEPQRVRDALDWMRTDLPADAVVLADDVRLSVGVWCERRMFFSVARFSRQQRALWNPLPLPPGSPAPEQPYAPRENAQREFLAQPSAEGLARIHALLGDAVPLYALRSPATMTVHDKAFHADAPPRTGPDPLDSFPGAECVYKNEYAAVYRLP